MKDFDQKKLDALLAENRFSEAKEYITASLTAADANVKADAAIEYTLAYIKSANAINADYLKSLKETLELFEKTKRAEGKVSDMVKLAKLKSELDIK
jgi:hypothetical protein